MLLAVQLDGELGGVIEVDNEAVEWNLSSELRAMKPGAAQALPKDVFGLGRLPPQQSRELAAVERHALFLIGSIPSPPTPLPRERGRALRFELPYHHHLVAAVVDHLDRDRRVFARLEGRARVAGEVVPDAFLVRRRSAFFRLSQALVRGKNTCAPMKTRPL